jgi:arsenate reductase
MNIVIHHNPDCGASRNVPAIIEAAGYQPTVAGYLKTGWTRGQLLGLFAAADWTPRAALPEIKSPAKELRLLEAGTDDETLLAATTAHPILVSWPIVCPRIGARSCRPSRAALDSLDRLPPGPMHKENGALLIDSEGRRVG